MHDRIFRRNQNVVFRDIAGELILVPIQRSADAADSIYVLNETGARIWELTDGRRTISQIAGIICEEYDTDRSTAEKDLLSYVRQMVEAGALEEM